MRTLSVKVSLIRYLGAFRSFEKTHYARLSAWNSAIPTREIFVKFHI